MSEDRPAAQVTAFTAPVTVLATGGAGRIYASTTNPTVATGDGIAMAWRAGATVANLEFFQFHPTALAHPGGRTFLISEALRGYGAVVVNHEGEAFVERQLPGGSLATRDVVARAIVAEMRRSGRDCVYLDATRKDPEETRRRFPNISRYCAGLGIDITRRPIPVAPAAHYLCGGVHTDVDGRTDLPGLYAIGEVGHTGFHGANRLASNSLLEAVVLAGRAVQAADGEDRPVEDVPACFPRAPRRSCHPTCAESRLGRIMLEEVGITRSDAGLRRACEALDEIEPRGPGGRPRSRLRGPAQPPRRGPPGGPLGAPAPGEPGRPLQRGPPRARRRSLEPRQPAAPGALSRTRRDCPSRGGRYIPLSPRPPPRRESRPLGIVVLDFGGQYAHLIANRIRRLHVWAEIRRPDTPVEELARADGLILSGGPSSVYADDRPPFEEAVLSTGKPILGLCYGHQLLCHTLGGRVQRGERMEYGAASLEVTAAAGVLAGLNRREPIWMSHRDRVEEIPPGFEVLGRTGDCPVAAMGDEGRRIYGLQFHPEVTHTESGMRILGNFLDLCGCERDWTMEGFIDRSMEGLKAQTRGRKVFLLVSGGVDSTVCFLLLNRALGTGRVLGLHIDNGFMRKGETAAVESLLKESGFSNLRVVEAGAAFLSRVAGVADPEAKRLAIGEEFIEVRDRVLAELDLDPEQWLLGQGTLYTDTIESGGTDHAEVIKTHHNRVGVIERLLAEGKVVEPLSQLYKDEVRELGEKMGGAPPPRLAASLSRPGLGGPLPVRGSRRRPGRRRRRAPAPGGPGSDRGGPAPAQRRRAGGRAHLCPPCAAHRISEPRSCRARGAAPSWDDLERASTELTNSTDRVNRVLFQLGPERRLSQRQREAYLTTERLDLLREADAIVMEALDRHGLMPRLTQMPTVLVPLSSDGTSESIVLRPVTTEDFMTARFGRLPAEFLREVTGRLLALEGVEAVYYDVTHKPPGTVEWE